MKEEILYNGNKKIHKKEMFIILVAYIFVIFIIPYLLLHFDIVKVYATTEAWKIKGNVNLAFIIMITFELLSGIIVGYKTNKGLVYILMILLSFLIKLILYILFSVILFWTIQSFFTDMEFLNSRLIISYYAFNNIFFIAHLLGLPSILGVQIGIFLKNKLGVKHGSKN